MQIQELARAKVNLTLDVLGRRPDGYHELASLVAFASLGDMVTLDVGQAPAVTVGGPFAPQLGSEYLIGNTLKVLSKREPRLRLGAVHLDKRLPVAAGVGGGSADAAAVLRAVRRANEALADEIDWTGIAAGLGADVPVCLANRLSFMRGIGERVDVLPALEASLQAILVNPLTAVPDDKTAQVFRALKAGPIKPEVVVQEPRGLSMAEDVETEMRRIGNGLEAAARSVMPVVSDVLAVLQALPGCRIAAMSGAGPTCFALMGGDGAAMGASSLRASQPGWWVEAVELG